MITERITAGEVYSKCLVGILYSDYYNQYCFGPLDASEASLTKDNFEFNFRLNAGYFCLQKINALTFEAFYTSTIVPVRVSLDIKNFPTLETNKSSPQYEYKLQEIIFELSRCASGEYFSIEALRCYPCEPNFFSFQDDFLEPSSCRGCAPENFYCYGGANITPKPGYWRRDYLSTNIIKCLNFKGI